MKKADIRAGIEQQMKDLGVPADMWTFDRGKAELIFLAGGRVRKMTLKSGMSLRDFTYAMGKVEGWWDILTTPAPDLQTQASQPSGE